MKAADDALHSGDTGPRKALWSAKEPVTVFGAAMSATGRAETQAAFDWVASRYTGFESAGWEILSADVSGDLAYVVAIEHTTTSIGGVPSIATPIRSRAASPPATASLAARSKAPAPGRHGRAWPPSTCSAGRMTDSPSASHWSGPASGPLQPRAPNGMSGLW